MSCEENGTDMRGTQVKHTADEVILYADFTDFLQFTSNTISSVAVTCTDDVAITLGTPSVIGTSTTLPWLDEQGAIVSGTIAANKGAKVLVSGGTAQEADAEPIRIWWEITLDNGEVINRAGRLRVEE